MYNGGPYRRVVETFKRKVETKIVAFLKILVLIWLIDARKGLMKI